MTIGDLILRVLADTKGFDADLQKTAQKSGDKAGLTLGGRMQAGLKKSFAGGKGQLLGALGIGAGLGAATLGVAKLTEVIGDSIDAASDQREAMSLTGQVFEENTEQMRKWAEGAAEDFGQSTTEALQYASNFGTAFKNVGFALDETSEKSREMTALAADLGSAFNAGADEAALALRSGLLGESEPLRRFGVFLDEAKTKAKAVQLGIANLGDTLTDNQKVTARYALIMEQTADSQGMFGRDSESLADAQKSLAAEMENVSAELGEALLPFMTDLVKVVKDELLPVLRDMVAQLDDSAEGARTNADAFGNLLNVLHDLFKEEETPARTFLGTLFDGLNDVAEATQGLASNINDAWTFWDQYTDAGEDARIKNEQLAETAREAGRGIGVAQSAAENATGPVEDLGETGKEAGQKLKRAGEVSLISWRDFAAAIIEEARGRIDTAYQIIDDRAALSAANHRSAELAKVIATGNATTEQKREYQELGEEQAGLLLDLAQNGVKSGKTVNTAVEQMRKRLKTAVGQEKKAIQELLAALAKVGPAARAQAAAIAAISTGVAAKNRHTGGPVSAGQPYIVGEYRPELFVPKVDGTIIPSVPAGFETGAASSVVNNYPTLTVQGALPVRTIRDVSIEMQRITEGVTPSRALTPQYPRGEV